MSDGALRGTRLGATSYENDDHVELGNAGHHLTLVAVGPEGAEVISTDPPVQAVVPPVVGVLRPDRAGCVHPALGQDPAAVADAVT